MLKDEKMLKYKKIQGQAKMNFLALNKKSRERIMNSYFKNELSNHQIDELVEKFKEGRVF